MLSKTSLGDSLFQWINGGLLIFCALVTLYPMWHELSLSLSAAEEATRGGLFLWPRGFNLEAYKIVLQKDYVWLAYSNSIFVTIAGTILSVLLTATTAYPLTKQGIPGRHVVMVLILITMLFSGGLIPKYLLVKSLGLIDSLWALIIPAAITGFNVIIMRTFFANLPVELEESAMIDGANPIYVFYKIILPLSKPVLSTIALWEAVGYWNNFFSALIYLNDKDKYTLPVMLRDVINGQAFARSSGELTDAALDAIIAATIIVSIVPILCVYPFIQKHFVKGVMIGAVKS